MTHKEQQITHLFLVHFHYCSGLMNQYIPIALKFKLAFRLQFVLYFNFKRPYCWAIKLEWLKTKDPLKSGHTAVPPHDITTSETFVNFRNSILPYAHSSPNEAKTTRQQIVMWLCWVPEESGNQRLFLYTFYKNINLKSTWNQKSLITIKYGRQRDYT